MLNISRSMLLIKSKIEYLNIVDNKFDIWFRLT